MSIKTPKSKTRLRQSKVFKELNNKIQKKIILMDGAMGTMIQQENLSEEDYRGNDNFSNCKLTENQIEILNAAYKNGSEVKGNNELLSITQPQIVKNIHERYLQAGAEIIGTNTFGATTIAQSDYNLESLAYDMNLNSAKLACEARDKYSNSSDVRLVYSRMVDSWTVYHSHTPLSTSSCNTSMIFSKSHVKYSRLGL